MTTLFLIIGNKLLMTSVLITGGSGYLGGRIANYLSEHSEYNIIIASRNHATKFNYRKIDWNSKKSINDVCIKIDIIIHLAAMNAKECLDNPDEAYKVNTLNTKNLIESAILNKVKKVIYFSTAHVYSSCLSGLIDENTKTNNEHPYAKTHLLAEKFILDFDKKNNFQGIILRLSNSFGPPSDINSNCWMLFANDICKSAVLKSKIFIKSNPLQVRDFVTLSDVCRVTKHFLDYKVESNPVFNIGGRSSFTLIDFSKLVQKQFKNVFSEKIEIISNSKNKTKPFLNYNIRKLESTGFVLQSKIEDEIVSLIKFCKKNF
tara:strand:- start:15584 stop:16537 length:954 start_codon:yes stop_codon:yes gene_type:complete